MMSYDFYNFQRHLYIGQIKILDLKMEVSNSGDHMMYVAKDNAKEVFQVLKAMKFREVSPIF